MNEVGSGEISIQDAIRLKHDLNNSIKYGGYNAKEIKDLESLSESERDVLNEHLAHINKVWWFFPDWFMGVGFVVAGFFLFFFQNFPARIFCLVALIYCVTQVAWRLGVYFGYSEGYRGGHEDGVHRALNISPDEASEISDRAREMEMDDRLIGKLDQTKN